jgi:outer membrane receptor protein involved in Fe transport
VVNFVLNKDFQGVRGSLQAGVSEEGDAPSRNVEIAFGRQFADGRGHLALSGEYINLGVAGPVGSRSWYQGHKVIANPAFVAGNGQPRLVVLPNVGISNATEGGLIVAGPLRGTQFGPGGVPAPFNFGFTSGLQSAGGTAEDSARRLQIQNDVKLYNLFGRIGYDLSPDIRVFAEANYADQSVFARNVAYNRFGNITIRSDNAFLDPTTRSRLIAANQATFTMGRINEDLGSAVTHLTAKLFRTTVGIDGTVFSDWRWNAYYQYGDNQFVNRSINNANIANYNLAIDAVRNPANGQIVCRSTLTSPTNGCVPLNIFGSGSFAPEARAYVLGSAIQNVDITQHVAAINVNGELFSSWREPVSVAAGLEYRKSKYDADADPISLVNGWWTGNFKPSGGEVDVSEGYLEFVAPILYDLPLIDRLVLNGAVRVTDYSESGSVVTWKVGATWDVSSELKIRGTRSLDIRAPNLNELFQSGGSNTGQILDPFRNVTGPFISVLRGNLALKPEEADTYSIGAVYRPSWFSGFSASIDYYDIQIQDAISVLPATTTLTRCFAGEAELCNAVIRDATGAITQIIVQPVNVQSEKTRGIDLEVSYRVNLSDLMDGWDANLSIRALTNYVFNRTIRAGTQTFDYAGALADDTGVPDLRIFLTATYEQGPFQGTLSARHIGEGVLRNEWGPADIADNNVPSVTYFDLGLTWRFTGMGRNAELFGVVENLFDKAPPIAPITTTPTHINFGTNAILYDLIGRQYRSGVRFRF